MQPSPANSSGLSGFRLGFAAPREGFRYLRRHRELWPSALAPLALNLLITGALAALLVWGGIEYARHLHPRFAGGFLWRMLELTVMVGLVIAALGVTAASWLLLQAVLCGHFYTRLARRVELQLGARPEELMELSFVREAIDGLRQFATIVAINLGLLCLHFVPVLGSALALVTSVYFDCWFLGKEFLQYPLAMRGLGRSEVQRFAKLHRSAALGLGAGTLLLSLLPVVNAVFLTTTAIGAVLLRRKLEGEPQAPPEAPPSQVTSAPRS